MSRQLYQYLLSVFLPFHQTEYEYKYEYSQDSNAILVQNRLKKLTLGLIMVNSGWKPVFLANQKMGTYFSLSLQVRQTIIQYYCPNIAFDDIWGFRENVVAIRQRDSPTVTLNNMQNGYFLGYTTPFESPIWEQYSREPEKFQLYYVSYDLETPPFTLFEPQFIAEIVVTQKDEPEPNVETLKLGPKFMEVAEILVEQPTVHILKIEGLEIDNLMSREYQRWIDNVRKPFNS